MTGPSHAACGRDHPRIRGEHELVAGHAERELGIIPAYAGSTMFFDVLTV